jgi:hypothetical protein
MPRVEVVRFGKTGPVRYWVFESDAVPRVGDDMPDPYGRGVRYVASRVQWHPTSPTDPTPVVTVLVSRTERTHRTAPPEEAEVH